MKKPAANEWIAEHEKNGLPAKEIYSLVKIALTGENPEQAMLAANTPTQIESVASTADEERTKKTKNTGFFHV